MLADFQSEGWVPVLREWLKISVRISAVKSASSVRSFLVMLSGPGAFPRFRYKISLRTPSVLIVISGMGGGRRIGGKGSGEGDDAMEIGVKGIGHATIVLS